MCPVGAGDRHWDWILLAASSDTEHEAKSADLCQGEGHGTDAHAGL